MALANVTLTNTFDEWRTRTNQLIVRTENYETQIPDLYNKIGVFPSYPYANNIGIAANSFASATIAGANTAVGAGANAYARLVGAGANAYMIAIQNGSNTAVGTGANNYLLAVISGANTAVGTGANNYLLAVISGANTAVGNGANVYATAVGAGANAYMIAVQNGSNTAVGAGANAYMIAVQNGSNTAVGAGANAYAALVAGYANTNAANATYITTGTLATSRGGTNSSATPTSGGIAYGDGTKYNFTSQGTSGQVLRSSGSSAPIWDTVTSFGTIYTSDNATYKDFIGIPSYARRIYVVFYGFSTSGTDPILIQLGTSAGIVSTNYVSTVVKIGATNSTIITSTSGMIACDPGASSSIYGQWVLSALGSSSTEWVGTGTTTFNTTAGPVVGSGGINIVGIVDRIRITTTDGNETFDDGKININWN